MGGSRIEPGVTDQQGGRQTGRPKEASRTGILHTAGQMQDDRHVTRHMTTHGSARSPLSQVSESNLAQSDQY